MAIKQLVHKTFNSLNEDLVSKDVEELVSKLVKQGYKIKVLVENHNHVHDDNSTTMVYQTTILATAHKNIDISPK